MTDLATAITCIDACGMAGVTPKLEADPGVGKSSHLRALAERLPFGRLALLQPPKSQQRRHHEHQPQQPDANGIYL